MNIYFAFPLGIVALIVIAIASFFPPTASGDHVILGHLLAVAIGISGVTVPLIILYRASVGPNIRIFIAQKMDAYFASVNVRSEDFMAAYAEMQPNPPNANDLLVILGKAYAAKGTFNHKTQKYEPFPSEVSNWLLKNLPKHQRWLSFFFDFGEDQPISFWYLAILVAFAVLCFFDLYARYVGVVDSSNVDGFADRVFILMTMGINFSVYCVLTIFVLQRRAIEHHIDAEIFELCPQVVSKIREFVKRAPKRLADVKTGLRGTGR